MQDAVVKYFNTKFISCQKDLGKGDGKLFSQPYAVRSIPTHTEFICLEFFKK